MQVSAHKSYQQLLQQPATVAGREAYNTNQGNKERTLPITSCHELRGTSASAYASTPQVGKHGRSCNLLPFCSPELCGSVRRACTLPLCVPRPAPSALEDCPAEETLHQVASIHTQLGGWTMAGWTIWSGRMQPSIGHWSFGADARTPLMAHAVAWWFQPLLILVSHHASNDTSRARLQVAVFELIQRKRSGQVSMNEGTFCLEDWSWVFKLW